MGSLARDSQEEIEGGMGRRGPGAAVGVEEEKVAPQNYPAHENSADLSHMLAMFTVMY